MPSGTNAILPLLCSACHNPLPGTVCNIGEPAICPSCSAVVRAEIFPAILRPAGESGSTGREISEGEASCFYHPEKQAVKVCSSCGRFLCALCDLELAGRCICPACLEEGRKSGEIRELVRRRTLYDSIALNAAIVPLFLWPLTLVTSPLALAYSIYAWRKPTSILPRTRIRLVVALILSPLQIAGWITLAINIFW